MVQTYAHNEDDPQKYIFGIHDFNRIPRWPNDGIEKHKKQNLNENHLARHNVHPFQRQLTELLGEWPSLSKDFYELDPMAFGFFHALPYQIQSQAAAQEQDFEKAKKHLLEKYHAKDDAVRNLLEVIGCKPAIHRAAQDPTRFPSPAAILTPLLEKNLGSDKNFKLLFGDISNVRGHLFELGPMLAQAPPSNSPAGAYMSKFTGQQKVKAARKICAACGKTESGDKTHSRCMACKSIHYCGRDCQVKHWPIHRPVCLEVQGKPVSQSMREQAEAAKRKREKIVAKEEKAKEESRLEGLQKSWKAFIDEDHRQVETYLFDCYGKRLKAHLPQGGTQIAHHVAQSPLLGLKYVETLSLGMFPDGIDHERYSFRGILYHDPQNGGASIVLLYINLYESSTAPSDCIAFSIDGIFVVDRVHKGRAQWKLVPEPSRAILGPSYTRLGFLLKYFGMAKERAQSVGPDVDLGIHNPGDPDLDMLDTAFGSYMKIRH